MRVKVALLAGALFLSAIGLPAQETADATKDAQVRRLVEAMSVKKMFDSILPQMIEQMNQQSDQLVQDQLKKADLPTERSETTKKIRDFISLRTIEEFKTLDMEGMTARIYSRYFTVDEIRALADFYESPAGKKMLEMTPKVLQDTMTETYAHAQQFMDKVMKDTREKFPEIFNPRNP